MVLMGSARCFTSLLPPAAPSVLDSALRGDVPIHPVPPWMSLAVLVYPRSLSHHCSDAFLVFPACRGGKPTCVMSPQGEKSAWHRLALHILLLGGRKDSRISCQQRACGHSHCPQHCQQRSGADGKAGAGMGPLGSHSKSPPPHWCLASPPTRQTGTKHHLLWHSKTAEGCKFQYPASPGFALLPRRSVEVSAGETEAEGWEEREGTWCGQWRAAASSSKVGRWQEGPVMGE